MGTLAVSTRTRPAIRPEILEELRQRLASISRQELAYGVLATGWPEIDRTLSGGLVRGALHEWIADEPKLETPAAEAGGSSRGSCPAVDFGRLRELADRLPGPKHGPVPKQKWDPPLGLFIHLLQGHRNDVGHICWIGPAVWPYPIALFCKPAVPGFERSPIAERSHTLLDCSLFIRAKNPHERLYAAELALRSGVAAAVIADGSGLDLTATRRLQLAAESGPALCLLARPPWEQEMLSAARTRWRVRPFVAEGRKQRWMVELLRCKGVQPIGPRAGGDALGRWIVERDHGTRDVRLVSDLVHRPDAAQIPPAGQHVG